MRGLRVIEGDREYKDRVGVWESNLRVTLLINDHSTSLLLNGSLSASDLFLMKESRLLICFLSLFKSQSYSVMRSQREMLSPSVLRET